MDIRSTYYGIDRNERLESAAVGGGDNGSSSEASLSREQSGSLAYIIRRCSRWERKLGRDIAARNNHLETMHLLHLSILKDPFMLRSMHAPCGICRCNDGQIYKCQLTDAIPQ
eukprot:scaffold1279_cov124-Skeletonema_dohrnii-CCMP3373.AAC.5